MRNGQAMVTKRLSQVLALGLWACGGNQDATPATDGLPRANLGGPVLTDELGLSPESVAGSFAGPACVEQSAGTEGAPAVLELLVDTSGSMDQRAPGVRGTKWTVTRQALLDAIGRMPQDTSLGVVFYPNVPSDSAEDGGPCINRRTAVNLGNLGVTGSQQRQRISRAFQGQRVEGGTPTHDAFDYAATLLSESVATGRRYLVLITDGIPTFSLGCVPAPDGEDSVDADPLIAAAAQARDSNLFTFVIGSPGSEQARNSLSRLAQAGGTASAGCSHDGPNYCHFDMTQERDLGGGLSRALGIITGVALGCVYEAPSPPAGSVLNASLGNLVFTPTSGANEPLALSTETDCTEGWQFADEGQQIRLCSDTCARLRDAKGSLNMEFACTTQVQ